MSDDQTDDAGPQFAQIEVTDSGTDTEADHDETAGESRPLDEVDEVDEAEVDEAGEDYEDLPYDGGPRSRVLRPAIAVASAAVVLAACAVGYQAVIPVKHVARSRLARLVIDRPGVPAYNIKPSNSAQEQASQTGLTSLQKASTKSPNETGVYAIDWAPSQATGMGLATFLFPTDSQASAGFSQLVTQQLAANSYTSGGLKRQSTFTLPGIAGGRGAMYIPAKKSASASDLVVTTFRVGRVIAVDEALTNTTPQADAITVANNEHAHLNQVEPGFSLQYVTHPQTATILWAAGSVALAFLVAWAPFGWRWRRRRREARWAAEMANRVVVRGAVIKKHRI